MNRRDVITLLGGAAAAWPLAAGGQQPVMPTIGFLSPTSPEANVDRVRGFRLGLKEQGYVEGENVAVEYRWAENRIDRLPELAGELVRRQVGVLAALGDPAAFAAKAATATIPILFLVAGDPVSLGLVASISRPGGNLTGVNIVNAELAAKRMELLRELVPRVARIAIFVNPADETLVAPQLTGVRAAARAMGVEIRIIGANTADEIDTAFGSLERERPDALFVATTPFLNARRVQLVQLAAFHRLPATYAQRDYVQAGGLMSYGSNIVDAYRQLGIYAGRVLKGTRPADLPVEQASKFELVVNRRTARMLGIEVPPMFVAHADEVIE
jgi:putative tryptophan/tyrosine transport system substrate-binding protein